MKPANQKSMVSASTARMAYLFAATGTFHGAMIKYASTRIVQTDVKMRKLTSAGEVANQCDVHQLETDHSD